MLRPRIIPCLLVRDKGLVKTVNFSNSKYVGDPINAVKIFNEKGVDELILLDIDATILGCGPDYRMIENIASESRMPLCYGGGIKTAKQAREIIGLGVEKVAISSAALASCELLTEIADEVGSQSVVAVLDVKMHADGAYEVFTHGGRIGTGRNPCDVAIDFEKAGVGEIVLNSINNDGLMKGYDLSLAEQVFNAISIPLTILGGAGSLKDIKDVLQRLGIIGAAAGSMFVFKGPFKAVLINYPSSSERDSLISDFF